MTGQGLETGSFEAASLAHPIKVGSLVFLMERDDTPIIWRDAYKHDFMHHLIGSFDWGELACGSYEGIPDAMARPDGAVAAAFRPVIDAIPDQRAMRLFYDFTRTESVLAKTGTHRQAQLVSLLAHTPAAVRAHVAD